MNNPPLPSDLDGYQLVRLSKIHDGDVLMDPDTGDKKLATDGWLGVFVDDQGREAGGSYVYRKYEPPKRVPADFPAGWQNVRDTDLAVGDIVILESEPAIKEMVSLSDIELSRSWAANIKVDSSGILDVGNRYRVYRKIPVAKQGLANDGTVLKNDQPVPDSKPTNPKDAIGSGKLPLDLVPETAVAYMALAFLEGGLHYGAHNYRAIGVRSSIYYAACRRHLMKWWNGEWADKKTGVPHLASALACIAIILDADSMKKLTDDRPPANPGLVALIDSLGVDHVARLKELFKNESPKHWTIQDKP